MAGNEKSSFWILVYIHKIFQILKSMKLSINPEIERRMYVLLPFTKCFDGKFAK